MFLYDLLNMILCVFEKKKVIYYFLAVFLFKIYIKFTKNDKLIGITT